MGVENVTGLSSERKWTFFWKKVDFFLEESGLFSSFTIEGDGELLFLFLGLQLLLNLGHGLHDFGLLTARLLKGSREVENHLRGAEDVLLGGAARAVLRTGARLGLLVGRRRRCSLLGLSLLWVFVFFCHSLSF
jgi:hypothetical protein